MLYDSIIHMQLVYILNLNILLVVATTIKNANVALVFSFLHKIVQVR